MLAVYFVVTIIGNVQKMKSVQNCTGFIFCHIQRLYLSKLPSSFVQIHVLFKFKLRITYIASFELFCSVLAVTKQLSMIRKCHNHRSHSWHHEEKTLEQRQRYTHKSKSSLQCYSVLSTIAQVLRKMSLKILAS